MDWQSLVNVKNLAAWMDLEGLGAGPIENPTVLTGGTQNLLLKFIRHGRTYVLRRPPLHSIVNGSETMRREVKTLAALALSDVPHARLIAACTDESVLGAAFYLMEPVDGFNASEGLPNLHAGDPELRRKMGFALLDGALALGRVDPFSVGLTGRIDNYLERQSGRWLKQYHSYEKYEGWPLDSLAGIDDLASWLDMNCPASFTPGILHGDYHLANVMYRRDGPELAAIVDWELTSVGDPLIDLGWVLATWADPSYDEDPVVPVKPWDGFPNAEELIEYYSARTDRDMSSLTWYKVLACYKLAILLEGSWARAIAGQSDKDIGARLHTQAKVLVRRAYRALD